MADTQTSQQSTKTTETATSITLSISRDAVDYDGKKKAEIEKTTTVERFDYECLRSRNAVGATYGATVKAVLHCTVKARPMVCAPTTTSTWVPTARRPTPSSSATPTAS